MLGCWHLGLLVLLTGALSRSVTLTVTECARRENRVMSEREHGSQEHRSAPQTHSMMVADTP